MRAQGQKVNHLRTHNKLEAKEEKSGSGIFLTPPLPLQNHSSCQPFFHQVFMFAKWNMLCFLPSPSTIFFIYLISL